MKRLYILSFIIFFSYSSFGQSISGNLKFNQGQVFEIMVQVKTTIAQQAMGQAIDFTVNANAEHDYKTTNTTEDNSTLHHKVKNIKFSFDGMGQKMKFDSDEEKDMKGTFGKPIKDVLEKNYDIIIDPSGTVLMARPEKITLSAADSRMAIITTMLKMCWTWCNHRKKGDPVFLKFYPIHR